MEVPPPFTNLQASRVGEKPQVQAGLGYPVGFAKDLWLLGVGPVNAILGQDQFKNQDVWPNC